MKNITLIELRHFIQSNFKKSPRKLRDFLYFDNYILYTKLDSEKIFQNLKKETNDKYFLRIVNNQFQIYRYLDYRNSVMPYLQGTIFPEKKFSFVSIRVRIHWVSKLVLTFFIILLGINSLNLIYKYLFQSATITRDFSMIPVFIAFLYGPAYLFVKESRIYKLFTLKTLKVKRIRFKS